VVEANGAEILYEAYDLVTGARQQTYDHPAKDYQQAVEIFEALTGLHLTVEQGILFMVAVKLSRLRTNMERGCLHHDSLVDTVGYLACLNMAAKGDFDGRPVRPSVGGDG
jgi:hypothetical protein